jgi:hypothetical protein
MVKLNYEEEIIMFRNQKALYRVVATTTKGIQSCNVHTLKERDERILNFMGG